MNRRSILLVLLVLVTAVAFGVMMSSCAKAPRKPEAALDTPEHHVFSGDKLLDKGDYAGAQREFELAIQLDKKYSPAYVGLGLVFGGQNNFDNLVRAHSRFFSGHPLSRLLGDCGPNLLLRPGHISEPHAFDFDTLAGHATIRLAAIELTKTKNDYGNSRWLQSTRLHAQVQDSD